MSHNTREDILRFVEEEDVEFIRLQFTDVAGTLKNVAITKNQLERALDGKYAFDGSAIEGFARVEESDMYLHPDLDTFAIFPWRPQQGKVARIICDVHKMDGKPFEGDPRHVLEKALAKAEGMGFDFKVGPECEFFLFDVDDNGNPNLDSNEKASYFDLGPNDYGENARRDIVLTMEDLGCEVSASHHEIAPGQHEVDLKHAPALKTADDFMTFKLAVKTVAKRHGMFASFMPKPKADVWGSGLHINISMYDKDEKNAFYEEGGKHGLSKTAYYFIGGVMKHIKAITLITNPLVNSYKRLVPGYEAPTDIAWSYGNRTPLIRIPATDADNKRIELRSPDPSMNPYLALAVIISAGLEGIENKILPPAEVQMNLFHLSEAEKDTLGIESMPESLEKALEAFEADEFIKGILGEHIANKIIRMKKAEWTTYRKQVSPWELEEYLFKI